MAKKPAAKSAAVAKADVGAIVHRGRRAALPTDDLRGFLAEDRKGRQISYPRGGLRDPRLEWRGRDDADLSVFAAPIYIQEKIAPRAIVEICTVR